GKRNGIHVRRLLADRAAGCARARSRDVRESAGMAGDSTSRHAGRFLVGRIGSRVRQGIRTRGRRHSSSGPVGIGTTSNSTSNRGTTARSVWRREPMASEKVKTFTDNNFDDETSKGVVLVDFWAEWCGPCPRLAPPLDALASEFDGRATVAKLNVDENPNVPGRFAVRGIPTLLLF